MAGAGALVPRMKEASVASFVVMIPLLIGYIVGLLAPMAAMFHAQNLLSGQPYSMRKYLLALAGRA